MIYYVYLCIVGEEMQKNMFFWVKAPKFKTQKHNCYVYLNKFDLVLKFKVKKIYSKTNGTYIRW